MLPTGRVHMYADLGACRPLPVRRPGTNGHRAALPGGTVTFAFTDIESSTDLVRRLGERYGEVLAQHRHIVRRAFCAARGIEIDRQGDAFFFAFPRACDAVGAAVEVQRAHARADWPGDARVQLRIGLHTGEPIVGAEGYLGLDVVRAARLCRIARGGHILVSETTRALVRSALPDGVSVVAAGERQLKGIDDPERVYELAIDGMEDRVPIPAALEREIEERFGKVGLRIAACLGEHVTGLAAGGEGREPRASRRPRGRFARGSAAPSAPTIRLTLPASASVRAMTDESSHDDKPADRPEYEPPRGAETTATWGAGDTTIEYTASAGWLVLRKKDKPSAEIFSVSYVAAGGGRRPAGHVRLQRRARAPRRPSCTWAPPGRSGSRSRADGTLPTMPPQLVAERGVVARVHRPRLRRPGRERASAA